MPDMTFDVEHVNLPLTQFGVGTNTTNGPRFVIVPTSVDVKEVLHKGALATWKAMQKEESQLYDPADKFGSIEYLHLPLSDAMASVFRELHEAENIEPDATSLADPSVVSCYFARFIDSSQRRLTALRRASQFKSLGSRPLVSWISDELRIVEDPVFKIDSDFDILLDSASVHILRPSAFEFLGNLRQFILAAVQENSESIGTELSFLNMSAIQEYAAQRPRAARYLASIRSRGWARGIDRDRLEELCESCGVDIVECDGSICVSANHIMGFIEILDRRRYEIGLVADAPEQFRAASRQRIDVQR